MSLRLFTLLLVIFSTTSVLKAQSTYTTPYAFTTFAGSAGVSGSTDATGSAARFNSPYGLTVDGAGNLYLADNGNHTIRKITPAGVVTTFAGTAGSSGSTDATGSAARFNFPFGTAVDGSGNVYVADYFNYTVRKITPAGVVTTLAGSAGNSGSADGTGSAARFNVITDVAVDGSGNVYVADYGNHMIRKVTPTGVVTTLAGLAGNSGSADGTGSAARFKNPNGVAVDAAGNVFVADYSNQTIRKITPTGVVTTIAGSAGIAGVVDGTGTAARFSFPSGVAVDGSGNVYVVDYLGQTIRKISYTGVVTTIGGLAATMGATDGTGSAALFKYPVRVTVDGAGSVYVSDNSNNTIRKGTRPASALWITTQPLTQTVRTGTSVTFTVGVGGTPSPTYQWQKDGTAISGATSATLVIPNVRHSDSGSYTVVATNSISSVISNPATLTDFTLTSDFNSDGQTDILWQNTATGQRALWLMNGIGGGFTPASIIDLGYVDTNWQMAGTGDFNNDNQTDILWQNTATGQRALWLMNGIGGGLTPASIVNLGWVDTNWQIAGTGDFNADAQTDILWQNTVTGQRALWLMNGIGGGFTPASIVNLGNVDTNWRMSGTGDFNADRQTDILWQNMVTGQRALWMMNGIGGGFTPASIVDLGYVDTNWRMAN